MRDLQSTPADVRHAHPIANAVWRAAGKRARNFAIAPTGMRLGPQRKGRYPMSKLLLQNVFLGGISVVAVSVVAMRQGSGSPAKPGENPDASFVQQVSEGDLAEVGFNTPAANRAMSPKLRGYSLRE